MSKSSPFSLFDINGLKNKQKLEQYLKIIKKENYIVCLVAQV